MTIDLGSAQEVDLDGDGTSGGGGNVGSSSWTGGDGGDAKAKKRAMQGYLQVIYNLYGVWAFTSAQQALANKAWKYRFSPSAYLSVLRREDPRYTRTDDYKNRVRDATYVYQAFRGYGRPMPKEFADQYARSGMNKQRLVSRIQETKWFKDRFPNWKQAVNSGVIGNTAGGAGAYISMRNMLNNAFKAQGQEMNPLLQRMMFSAGMTEEEVARNLATVFGGQEALSFASGGLMAKDDILKAALTKKYGTRGLGQIQQAASRTKSFQESGLRPFDVGVDEQTGQIVLPRI